MVVVDKAHLGDEPRFEAPAVDRVKHAGRGGAAVLGVGGHDEHALHAFGFQGVELRWYRWLAVAHGVADCHMVATLLQGGAQRLGLLFGEGFEGRALLGPDAGVFGGRFGRTHAQDDAVQNQPPDGFGDLDHAAVAQKLGQVLAQGWGGGGTGRAQVAVQHRCAGGLTMLERGFFLKCHAVFSHHHD